MNHENKIKFAKESIIPKLREEVKFIEKELADNGEQLKKLKEKSELMIINLQSKQNECILIEEYTHYMEYFNKLTDLYTPPKKQKIRDKKGRFKKDSE